MAAGNTPRARVGAALRREGAAAWFAGALVISRAGRGVGHTLWTARSLLLIICSSNSKTRTSAAPAAPAPGALGLLGNRGAGISRSEQFGPGSWPGPGPALANSVRKLCGHNAAVTASSMRHSTQAGADRPPHHRRADEPPMPVTRLHGTMTARSTSLGGHGERKMTRRNSVRFLVCHTCLSHMEYRLGYRRPASKPKGTACILVVSTPLLAPNRNLVPQETL